ncbi:hypothetical protein AB7M59_001243 [Bradyrhizobium elkanii]
MRTMKFQPFSMGRRRLRVNFGPAPNIRWVQGVPRLAGDLTYSNAKIRLQSFFMSTTVHLFTAAASSAISSLPKCDWRS